MRVIIYIIIALFIIGIIIELLGLILDFIIPILLIIAIIAGLVLFPKITLIIIATGFGAFVIFVIIHNILTTYHLPDLKKIQSRKTETKKIEQERKKKEQQKKDEAEKRKAKLEELSDADREYVLSGYKYVGTFSNYVKEIDSSSICASLSEIIDLLSKILNAVVYKPNEVKEMRLLFSYYLPTIDKVITAYIRYQNEEVTGDFIEDTKVEIEGLLTDVKTALVSYLNQLYRDDSMEISSEIHAMKQKMEMDGLNEKKDI